MDRTARIAGVGALLALLALLGPACAELDGPAGGSASAPDGAWRLVEGETDQGEVPVVAGADITLRIDGEDWSGTAACNDYHATVAVDGRELAVSEVVATEVACPGEGVMASESAYLAALRRVEAFERGEGTLTLTGDGVRLRFEPAEAGEEEAGEM